MVVFDATALLLFLDPDAKPPLDPTTGSPTARCKERIDHLTSVLDARKDKIVIPTPVLSEVLVRAGDAGPEYLDILNRVACFRIAPFDQRAAVEVAAMTSKRRSARGVTILPACLGSEHSSRHQRRRIGRSPGG